MTPLYIGNSHATLGYLFPAHLGCVSNGLGPMTHLLILARSRHLRPSPTGASSGCIYRYGVYGTPSYNGMPTPPPVPLTGASMLCIYRNGAPLTPPYTGTLTPPPAASYQFIKLVYLPEWTRWHTSLHGHAHDDSCNSLTTHPGGAPPRNQPLPNLSTSATPIGALPYGGAFNAALHRHACTFSHYLRIVALSLYISREGPCHASLHRHANAASGRILQTHLFGLSTGMGPMVNPPILTRPCRQRSHYTGTSSWCIYRDRASDTPP